MAKNIDDLLRQKFGAGGYEIVRLDVTWSEQLAVWLNAIAPVLMGLGVLCLFIEFKTPGFGFFGIAGIALLAVVFLGHYVAGFSGHEPMILFRPRTAAAGRGGVLLSRRGGHGGERGGAHARLAGVGDGRHLAQRARDHHDLGRSVSPAAHQPRRRPRLGAGVGRAARPLPAQRLAVGPDGVAGGGRILGAGGGHGAGGRGGVPPRSSADRAW